MDMFDGIKNFNNLNSQNLHSNLRISNLEKSFLRQEKKANGIINTIKSKNAQKKLQQKAIKESQSLFFSFCFRKWLSYTNVTYKASSL